MKSILRHKIFSTWLAAFLLSAAGLIFSSMQHNSLSHKFANDYSRSAFDQIQQWGDRAMVCYLVFVSLALAGLVVMLVNWAAPAGKHHLNS